MFQPYAQYVRATLASYFAYRLNFALWRLRAFIQFLVAFMVWEAVFRSSTSAFGYSSEMMLTYIIVSGFLGEIVLSTRIDAVAGMIIQGDIIEYLLKPISFFKVYMATDFVDKMLNAVGAIIGIIVVILLFQPVLLGPPSWLNVVAALIFLLCGLTITFCINMVVSMMGFWTHDIWAYRFLFYIINMVVAGGFFPIDILPSPVFYGLLFTPFPYMFYFPTKAFLGMPLGQMIIALGGAVVWSGLTIVIMKYVWHKGLREYSFPGR